MPILLLDVEGEPVNANAKFDSVISNQSMWHYNKESHHDMEYSFADTQIQ
jgi:hypothetical protein